MDILLLFILSTLLGWGGYWISMQPTVTAGEQHRIIRGETAKQLLVRADWDAAAGVWVASSYDVPGLATEAATVEALDEKLRHLVPTLLKANGRAADMATPIELVARRFSAPVAA